MLVAKFGYHRTQDDNLVFELSSIEQVFNAFVLTCASQIIGFYLEVGKLGDEFNIEFVPK